RIRRHAARTNEPE
ncbi:acrB/AcrD/AcrF family protein, partial [Vibrio parahaemolyticus VPTS-2010]